MSTIEHTKTVSDEHTQIIHHLSETASKIALQNFEWRYITLLLFNSTLWCGVELFLRSYDRVVVVGRGTFYPRFEHNTRQFVLFGTTITNIVDTLEWMRIHEFDNTGKHIIICQSLDPDECDEVTAVRELWQHKITNVIFLKNIGNNVTGFTYFPLTDSACNYLDLVRLENMTSCSDSREACDIFPIKLRNLNTCPLIASTFIQKPYMKIENGEPIGADGDLIRLLAEKLNASLNMMTPRIGDGWGKTDQNDTWVGSLADLYHDYANLSITSASLTVTRCSSFQMSNQYGTVSVVWITHAAKKISSSFKLAYPFKQYAQIAIVISFAFVVISSILIQSRFWFRCNRKNKMNRPRTGIVFYSWMICMGQPTTRLPTKTAFLYIVLLWMWYGVLLRTFYQASLMTTLKSNYYYKDLETIDNAIEAEYPFRGGSALKDFYVDHSVVYNQWTDVNTSDIIPTLRKLAQGMEFVLAMNLETAKTIIWEEKIHVHMLTEKIVTSPTVIFFKKYSPLTSAVNSILVRLVECGFYDKFYRDYTSTFPVHRASDSLESIKLQHYTGCYVVLIAGWFISFLLLVTEILFDKVYKQHGAL